MRVIAFSFIMCLSHTLFSQISLHNNNWLLGYDPVPEIISEDHGIIHLDFRNQPISIETKLVQGDFDLSTTAYSDADGNLVLLTNGRYIYNRNLEIVENGDSICVETWTYEQYLDCLNGPQCAVLLPMPARDSIFYVFVMEPTIRGQLFALFDVRYTTANINANDGQGKVIEKSQLLFSDTLDYGKMRACKHANGRDWWIIVPKYTHNIKKPAYHRMLLTPEGVQYLGFQTIGKMKSHGSGEAVFSPDGSIYVRGCSNEIDRPGETGVLRFDRCAGLFSHEVIIDIGLEEFKPEYRDYTYGVAISPNNRYLYHCTAWHLYQFDLQAEDIAASQIEIAEFTAFEDYPLLGVYVTCELAPDGKIYVGSRNGVKYLHVIHNPNEAGLACNFEERGLPLPHYNTGMPTFPNFALGPLDGSACDSLGIDNPFVPDPTAENIVKILPNPTNGYMAVQFTQDIMEGCEFLIYNALGQELLRGPLVGFSTNVYFPHFPSGVYFYAVRQGPKVLQGGKLVKM